MVRVMKSPNMISTPGRIPVIAAPTASPVNPASEIGVSTTRSLPNSSTSPESTLNGVPASATSSPKMHTLASRRISSARASRTAWANVSSRSGIDVLVHLLDTGIRRGNGELDRTFHLSACFGGHRLKSRNIGVLLLDQPIAVQLDGIASALSALLSGFRPIVFAIDVANVMPAVAVRVRLEKRRPFSGAGSLHEPSCDFIYRADILAVNDCRLNSESRGAAEDRPGGRLREVCVFVIKIVLAK